MAGEDRTTARDLAWLQSVAEAPYRYSLFGVLRRLERGLTDAPRFGESVRPVEDPIRLAQTASMAFAPAELSGVSPGSNGGPTRLEIFGFGFLGPNGPLPLHLTEYVRDRRLNHGDATLSRFLDMFHHRLISLFYRAWANAEPTVEFERGNTDRFAVYVGSLFGLGFGTLRQRDALPDVAKLHLAGGFALQNRTPGPLREMLREYFRVPVEIAEFIGEWLEIPARRRWRLGESAEDGTLGASATPGEAVWSRSHRFRIVIGPVGLADFRRFLPGRDSLPQLIALVRQYLGDELAWDVNLVLKKAEVPALCLGEAGELGLTAWLATDYRGSDADEALIDPSVARSASERSLGVRVEDSISA